MYPYNGKMGQKIQTNADGVAVDRAFLAHLQISADKVTAASVNGIHVAVTLTAATQAITTEITQPSITRNITITGNAVGIAGNVVIKGTNYNGDAITETIALSGAATVSGAKAFKTVTEIDLPIQTNVGTDTVAVGFGEVLGLPYKLSHNTILAAYLDNAKESTAPVVTVSATALESNTIDLNSALSGKVVDVYLIV